MITTPFLGRGCSSGLRSGHGVSHFEKGHKLVIINSLLKLRGFCRRVLKQLFIVNRKEPVMGHNGVNATIILQKTAKHLGFFAAFAAGRP